MRTSSRILLHLSRLIGAVAAVNRVAGARAWGSGARGVGRWSAPRRRPLASVRRGTRASGEERPVRTSSRILLHLSRLISAVAAVNRVAAPRAWAVGPQGAGGRVQSGRHVETCTGGRQVRVRAVSFGRTYLACRKNFRPLLPPPSIQKFGQQGAPAHERPSLPPPGTGLAARSASVASHTALFAQPSAPSVVALTPLPAPLFRLCTGWRRSAGGGICV